MLGLSPMSVAQAPIVCFRFTSWWPVPDGGYPPSGTGHHDVNLKQTIGACATDIGLRPSIKITRTNVTPRILLITTPSTLRANWDWNKNEQHCADYREVLTRCSLARIAQWEKKESANTPPSSATNGQSSSDKFSYEVISLRVLFCVWQYNLCYKSVNNL